MTSLRAWIAAVLLVFVPMPLALGSVFVEGAIEVASGDRHACAIVNGGYVKCWGDNGYGQLGNGSTTASSVAMDVPGLSGAVAISAGRDHSCAIVATPTRSVKCWGRFQLDGVSTSTTTPAPVAGLVDPVAIVSGGAFNCILESAGGAKCWGANSNGELGRGNNVASGTPASVVGALPASITGIAAGTSHACVYGGSAFACWGQGDRGRLGNGGTTSSNAAVLGSLPAPIVTLAAGADHTCAALMSGQYACWGGNVIGQLGVGLGDAFVPFPTLVVGSSWSGSPRIAAGPQFTCVASDIGNHCWGLGSSGQFGNGSAGASHSSRVPVPGPSGGGDTFTRLSAGGTTACAVTTAGRVRCWGANPFGQVGDAYASPVRTPAGTGVTGVNAIGTGYTATCVMRDVQLAQCSGKGDRGQLGDSMPGASSATAGGRSSFANVVGITGGSYVGVGIAHACALHTGLPGVVSCWGDSAGTGVSNTSTPLTITNLSQPTHLAVGNQHNCVTDAGGRLSCWGTNDQGQVGDGTQSFRSVPVQVIPGGVTLGATGSKHSCAVMADYTVRCWGANSYGEVGDGSTTIRRTPVSVPGLSDVRGIAAGAGFTCAMTSSVVKCWGTNAAGQLGDGTQTQRTTPVDVQGVSSPIYIVAGEQHACAIEASGTLKCWGQNGDGQLGVGGTPPLSTVALTVPGLSGVSMVSAGRFHTCASVGATRDLYCWGRNADGQLGNGSASYQTRPISVIDGSYAAALTVTGCPSPITAGASCSVTLFARTFADLPAVTYAGTVAATSSDDLAVLPADYAFLPEDAGTHAFGVTFNRAGTHHITFTDAAESLTATLSGIVVMPGIASTISAVSGTPQAAHLRHTFLSPLAARVTDGSGNPVPGAIVTFQLPDSGAAATFPGDVSSAVVNADADGVATTPPLTANLTPGTYSATASTTGASGTASFALTNVPLPPASITVQSGSPQSTPIGSAFASRLRAVVRNAEGGAVEGAPVDFFLPENGASGTFESGGIAVSVATDSHGTAESPLVTANATLGTYVATATVAGVASPAQFTLTNLPFGAASIEVVSGSGQAAGTGSAFAQPLIVRVLDSLGAPVGSVTVTFTVPASGASANLTTTTVTTGANGQAQVLATANAASGTYQVTATAAGVATGVNLILTNVARGYAFTVATGANFSCAITERGGASCWGMNGVGELGHGPIGTQSSLPVAVNAMGTPVVAIAANDQHACAVTIGGGVKCWGSNGSGELGALPYGQSPVPLDVTGISSGAVAVAAGYRHACAVLDTGAVKCWGSNTLGELGDGTTSTTPVVSPTTVTGLPPSTAIAAGYRHSCAVTQDGAAMCWGNNGSGQLGNDSFVHSSVPVLAVASGATAVAAETYYSCAVVNGGVLCWGANNQGQLGNGSLIPSPTPVAVTGLGGSQIAVTAGLYHACALEDGGRVRCWGDNSAGQLGNGSIGGRSTTPTDVYGIGNAVAISAGQTHTCAVLADGSTRCWGYNGYGQLGDGTTSTTGMPVSSPAFGGPATSVGASSGAGQSAPIQATFGQPLVAGVRDGSGNAADGFLVQFNAPRHGASAALSSRWVVADANGLAQVSATANETAGAYAVTTTVAGASRPATFALTNTALAPASIVAVQGSLQTTSVATPFALALKAQVKDAQGAPLAGISVTFSLPASGASGTFAGGGATANATTDATGVATSPSIVANTVLGAWNASASVAQVATPATFSLTNLAGAPSALTASGGTPQTTIASTLFGALLQANVSDAYGNPVAGAIVTFRLPASGPSANFTGMGKTATAVSDANGIASSPPLTATSTIGSFSATASTTGVAAAPSYALTTVARTGTTITATSGTPQSTIAGTAFAQPLAAVVRDSGGNPVPGLTLTFTIPGTTVSGTFAGGSKTITLITDAAGSATSPSINATTRTGSFIPYASVPGLARANFSLTIAPAAPATVTARVGAQMAPVYTPYAKPLAVRVTDQYTNVVPNVPVTFTLPATGASASFAGDVASVIVMTDTTGVATSPVPTANQAVGTYYAEATVTGVAAAATFKLTNTVGTGATLTLAGTPQSTVVGTGYAEPLSAVVLDAAARPVAGVQVTFTLPNSTLSATFDGGAKSFAMPTGSDGRAITPPMTATTRAGKFAPSLRAAGISGTRYFDLTNLAAAPATATATVGSQTAPIGTSFAKPLGVLVKDAYGNVVPNVTVRIDLPAGESLATFADGARTWAGATDAAGKAITSAVTASMFVASYVATSQVTGVASSPGFSLRNTLTANATLTATDGTPQSTPAGTAFAQPLQASVRDVAGLPIGGVVVTFTIPTSRGLFPDGKGTATVPTNAAGIAISPTITATSVKAAWTGTAKGSGITTGVASYSLTTQ